MFVTFLYFRAGIAQLARASPFQGEGHGFESRFPLHKKMNFDEYQDITDKTAIYPNRGKNIVYPTLGLTGEAGDVAEKVKKIIRDKDSNIDTDTVELIKKELGDVLWYLSQVAMEFGLTLNDVAEGNVKKLRSRKKRGTLKGDGDNR